jgi:hypothetical protein
MRCITIPLTEAEYDAAAAAQPAACSVNALCFPPALGPPPAARRLLADHAAERGALLADLAASREGRARLGRAAEAVRGLFAPAVAAARGLVEDLTSPPPSPAGRPAPPPDGA